MKNNNIILIAILSLIFASCDNNNELDNKELSGKEVAVRIHSMRVSKGGSENLGRASAQQESEMVSQSIGDGMLLEMSVKEDESPLRGLQELTTGAYFRVIAVTAGSSKYHSHGDFVYGGSNSLPEFQVAIGKSYDFICISYNTTDPDDLPDASGYVVGSDLPTSFSVDNTEDLLWWKSPASETIDPSGVELEITLKQKLAKVKVIVKCDYNKWKITGIANGTVGVMGIPLTCSMNWLDGTLTGTAADQWLTFTPPTSPYPMELTSNELRIIPTTSNAVIDFAIGAVSRDALAAVPSAKRSATLTQALSAGVSYTITVRLRLPIWARSNIYWQEVTDDQDSKYPGYLTFVPAATPPDTNDDTKQGYQGVFFKYGSLVGISPAQVGNSNEYLNQAVPVYVPTYNSTTPASSTWTATYSTAKGWTTWAQTQANAAAATTDIPYMDGSYAKSVETTYGRNNTYVMDDALNLDTTYQGLRGDICQYLCKTGAVSGDYRLPMSDEFGPLATNVWDTSNPTVNPNADGWVKGSGDWSSEGRSAGKADGTADLLIAANNNGNAVYGSAINLPMDVVFPAAGYRMGVSNEVGRLSSVGTNGLYWSGSAGDAATNGYRLYFNDLNVSSVDPYFRSYGASVRCVKN